MPVLRACHRASALCGVQPAFTLKPSSAHPHSAGDTSWSAIIAVSVISQWEPRLTSTERLFLV